MPRELAIDRQRTAAQWRVALLAAASCAAAACSFEFDREWIDQPAAIDAGPAGAATGVTAKPAATANAQVAKTLPDAAVKAPDAGSGLSCAQIDECCATCGESAESCYQACFDAGTPAAQRAFDAVYACFEQVINGVCESSCYDVSTDFCWDCADGACAAELQTCFDGAA